MIKRFFNSITEFFIPSNYQKGSEEHREARIIVNVFLITGASYILNSPSGLRLNSTYITYMLLTTSSLCFVIAYLFKKGLSRFYAAHLFTAFNAISFFLYMYWCGGTNSPSAPSLYLLVAVSMLLLGPRNSAFWLLVALGIITFFFWHEDNYGHLPLNYDTSQHIYYLKSGLYGTIICAFFILLVYEFEKKRGLKILANKNEELVNTQNQLIQSEKLASLGELMAGIAHEIQNPLNFVNNFSELSVDLAQELQEELQKEKLDKELISEIITDIVQNQEKINHHGKRASSIVKGMLEHSRLSSGERNLTNLNELAEEGLRLSYHSLRSKDKYFNAKFEMQFDQNVPKVKVAAQDLSRVIINLCNNAFYAVNKRKTDVSAVGYDENFEPKVIVSTQLIVGSAKEKEAIVISIIDNGIGIPKKIKDKIFQPFFTTKPTGEGTGLGLSLSYDIVTKGHGGNFEIESIEGEGTTFKIVIPTNFV